MTDEPRFRTVMRGYDQEQVAAAITELQTSLDAARRAAADRMVRLTQVTQAKATVEAELAELRSGTTATGESDPTAPGGATPRPTAGGFDALGARLTSILSLAEEEAEQLRRSATGEAQALRQEAVAAATALRTESEQYAEQVHQRADGELARMTSAATATSDAIVAQANEHAAARRVEADQLVEAQRSRLSEEQAQHEARMSEARSSADRIVAEARGQAEQTRRQTSEELEDALRRRDAVHAHLAEVDQHLAALEDILADGGRPPQLEASAHG